MAQLDAYIIVSLGGKNPFFLKTIEGPLDCIFPKVENPFKKINLQLLPRTISFWSNSPSSSTINNCFSPLLFLFLLAPTMITTTVA
jgi:hypothetical protein